MNAPETHEITRLRGRPFIVGAIVFFVFILTIFGVVWILLQAWSPQPWPDQASSGFPSPGSRWNLKAPQVQIDPAVDLEKLRQAENGRLHARHWNEGEQTYATIPIEDAMQLLAAAAAKNQLTTVLPAPQPAAPIDLQNQKSREAAPSGVPNP